jgi:hypothetical protein
MPGPLQRFAKRGMVEMGAAQFNHVLRRCMSPSMKSRSASITLTQAPQRSSPRETLNYSSAAASAVIRT